MFENWILSVSVDIIQPNPVFFLFFITISAYSMLKNRINEKMLLRLQTEKNLNSFLVDIYKVNRGIPTTNMMNRKQK